MVPDSESKAAPQSPGTGPAHTPPAAPVAPAATAQPTPQPWWADHVKISAQALGEWISQPRVRLALTGVILLLVGGLQLTSSVWTLPLVLAGALMLATAWIGHRLEGGFSVDWGKTGTQLGFTARIKPAHDDAAPAPQAPPPPDADVIEGEAHTVEIDVAELKALIAAAETRGAGVEPPEATAETIRILRLAADGDRRSNPGR